MDKILLQGLQFYGFHGLQAREKQYGQVFVVDVELYLDLTRAGREDLPAATVDYTAVFELIRRTVEEERFDLLEAVADTIARRVLSVHPVEKIRVRVSKPHPPVAGTYGSFGVEIERRRNGVSG